MSSGWENHVPAPLEFFHSELMKGFHEWRKSVNGNEITNESGFIQIDGIKLNNLIAGAKTKTYECYRKQVSDAAIPKTEL